MAETQTSALSEAGPSDRDRLLDPDGAWDTWLHYLLATIMVAFGAWHVLTNLLILESGIWQNAIHFGGFAFLATIMRPARSRDAHSRKALVADMIYGALVLAATFWVAWAEDGIFRRTMSDTGGGWSLTTMDWIAGLIVIFAAIDLTRRVAGWIIPALIVAALSYILFLGAYMPGVFRTASLPPAEVLFRSLYNDEGMFGTITTISSANITLFMIFGGFLLYSGASEFVIEMSKLVAARFRGGAAYVAVIASALTGTISGSAVANTASTGIITIPLMKSNGFRKPFAAGVEAASSTGGQLVPPIMGAGAFVMASYTGLPYGTIVAVSVLPAILYFASIAFMIRIETLRSDLDAAEVEPVEKTKLAAGALNFLLPLGVMIYMLVAGWTPSYAASVAIGVLILVSWLTPMRMTPERSFRAMMFGVRMAVMTAVLLASIGLVNNAITTSGVGGAFSLMIAEWSGGSILLSIVLIGLASLVLGMGLPVTAAYVILAILLAPALSGLLADRFVVDALAAGVQDPSVSGMLTLVDAEAAQQLAGGMSHEAAKALVSSLPFEVASSLRSTLVDPGQLSTTLLIAHLIIFWLSQDSNVTPPVCLAAFAAAGIAGARPFQTGVTSWKLAKGLYIVPLLFAYSPLISGDFTEALRVTIFALFGIYALNSMVQRHAEGPMTWWSYPLMILGGAGAFWQGAIMINIAGAGLVAMTSFLTAWRPAVREVRT